MRPKDENGMAISIDPYQTAPRICLFCSYLSENLGTSQYRKNHKNSDTENLVVIILKFERGLTIEKYVQKI